LTDDKNRQVFLTVREFHEYVKQNLDSVGLDPSFLGRYLNEGFSGGEKKRSEVMQMLVLRPYIAILDEPDSGLDIDAVKSVAEAINKLIDTGAGVLVITHYARILRYLKKLDYVHVVAKGRVIKSGGRELAEELETQGYGWLGIDDDTVETSPTSATATDEVKHVSLKTSSQQASDKATDNGKNLDNTKGN
jgi:Fe-S cluster assembly ATP-binding protein